MTVERKPLWAFCICSKFSVVELNSIYIYMGIYFNVKGRSL